MGILSALNYRLKVNAPRALALITGQLPLRSACDLYSQAAPSNSRIPKVVFQTWRNDRFGRSHLAGLREFRQRNPDYTFEFYDEQAMNAFMEANYGNEGIGRVFNSSDFGPLRTDIWRYCILYKLGGVYCDIGKSFTCPIDSLVPTGATAVVGFEQNKLEAGAWSATSEVVRYPNNRVINWGLMFQPEHPLLKRVIDGIVEKYPYYAGRNWLDPKLAILKFTGPIHLTECLHSEALSGGLANVHQSEIDFGDCANIDLPGSYVRYLGQRSYVTRRNCVIVD